jgi:hypothetical protein
MKTRAQRGGAFGERGRPARPRLLACGCAMVLLGGCFSAPRVPSIAHTGDPVIDGNAQLAAARPEDRVLWNYRIAAAAMRVGNFEEAKAKLDDAILTMGGIITNSAEAARARSLFSAERSKVFIGEPYERVMAYFYRGILYWRDGQPDNARACFRTAQFIDGDAEKQSYRSDYVLLDYLDGFASAKLGADGREAYRRAVENGKGRPLPPYDREANVLVFAEFGEGPRKYSSGEYGEQLRFAVSNSRVHAAVLTVGGQTVTLPAYDDLNYQAATRGGRLMDHILGNKAVFKSTTSAVGDVAAVGSIVAASRMNRWDGTRSEGSQNTALALGAVALISKIASAATTPEADTRTWQNLPQRLGFAALRLAPGEYPARVEFLDAAGERIAGSARELTVVVRDPAADTVIFLSELKR